MRVIVFLYKCLRYRFLAFYSVFLCFLITGCSPAPVNPATEYSERMQQLATSWNTWDTYSMYSFVSLPQRWYIKLDVLDEQGKQLFENLSWYNTTVRKEQIRPIAHTANGAYTESLLEWQDLKLRVQSVKTPKGYLLLVTPESKTKMRLRISGGYIWGGKGSLVAGSNGFAFHASADSMPVFTNPGIPAIMQGDSLVVLETGLTGPVVISAGEQLFKGQAISAIDEGQAAWEALSAPYGKLAEINKAMMSSLGWNTIFDPVQNRVLVPVSRSWNKNWNGYVLFCWDSYFASYMLSHYNRDLAYAVASEITSSITPGGFVPNFAGGGSYSSNDRSQPPVGSRMILEIYKQYQEKWFLQYNYDKLARWNRWWPAHRVKQGLLCWGSDKLSLMPGERDPGATNTLQGAMFESGLDNSPMYDRVVFDTIQHMMELGDVGLTSLYVMDCDALAEMAAILDKKEDAAEFRQRAEDYRKNLAGLWDEKSGIYRNKELLSGKLSPHLSPTNFYPMLAKAPSQAQAVRMVKEHLLNQEEFYGEWMIPSIARNDPGFTDNQYWRGRIWGPMNFLVYLGLLNYDLPEARKELADKSAALLLKEWSEETHVHENYNSVTADGDDVGSSDPFYHWGSLLGYIKLLEDGPAFTNAASVPEPEKK